MRILLPKREIVEDWGDYQAKVKIFDVYESENIPAGMKSLGLRFSYRGTDRTLTDDEVNEVHTRIVQKIVHATGASIR